MTLLRPALAAALLALAACGPPKTSPPPPEGPHLLWSADAQSLDNPYPDQRLIVDGHLTLRPSWFEPFLAPGAKTPRTKGYFTVTSRKFAPEVTSFGNFTGVLVRPSEPVDPKSLAGHVARLLKQGDAWTVLEKDVKATHLSEFLAQKGLDCPADFPEFFFVRPSVVIPGGADGLLVFLSGITTTGGRALERGREFQDSKPALAGVAQSLGVPESEVLLALPERGADTTSVFDALAVWAEAHPAAVTIPARAMVSDSTGNHPEGAWTPADADWPTAIQPWLEAPRFSRPASHVGQVIVGTYAARDLRDDQHHFKPEWVADPSLAPVVPIRFVLSLPKGAKPAGGWPLVIGQHGVGGRNTPVAGGTDSFCLDWAEPLAARGLGCFGIDAPDHGARGAFTDFFSVDDLAAMRDRFREMTFDLLQAERAAVTLDVDGDGASDVAPKVRYFGNSLGGIMGSSFVPFANRVSSAVLNVPGGGLTNVITSQSLQDTIGLLIVAKTDLIFDSKEYVASFPLFRATAQAVIEGGDPINHAAHTPLTRAVLVQEGLRDETIPNDTTDDLARAFGLDTQTASVSGSAPLRIISRVDPAKYLQPGDAATYNGHNVMWDIPSAREQVLGFLESDGRTVSAP